MLKAYTVSAPTVRQCETVICIIRNVGFTQAAALPDTVCYTLFYLWWTFADGGTTTKCSGKKKKKKNYDDGGWVSSPVSSLAVLTKPALRTGSLRPFGLCLINYITEQASMCRRLQVKDFFFFLFFFSDSCCSLSAFALIAMSLVENE